MPAHPNSLPQKPLSKSNVTVGFDILELITSGMYLEPLTIYREYIQNAADAIDEARQSGILRGRNQARVDIKMDPVERIVLIRDNGTGIHTDDATGILTSIGASPKRRKKARGFRGIGRLAGLGYCRELVFRTRCAKKTNVFEMMWDGQALKDALRRTDRANDLQSVVADIVNVNTFQSEELPDRFFEVELRGVVRHGNDILLNHDEVGKYVAQVASVPFAPEFSYGESITDFLSRYEKPTELNVYLDQSETPVYRPHRNSYPISDAKRDRFIDLETREFEAIDGKLAAVAWILHHGYRGVIPSRAGIKGFRARMGNIQVGDTAPFESAFPEPRFNHWTVGEIHILDRRIIPNGRRDHFEQNVHFRSLENQIAPLGRSIAKRCRHSSIRRNALRSLERIAEDANEQLSLLRLAPFNSARVRLIYKSVLGAIDNMERLLRRGVLTEKSEGEWMKRVSEIKSSLSKLQRRKNKKKGKGTKLQKVPLAKRKAYEEIIDLIYECAPSPGAAKALISRILARLE